MSLAAPGLAAQADTLLRGVHADWQPLISKSLLQKALAAIDAAGDAARTSPEPSSIFAFLRDCRPSEIRAVIVGQDPYARPEDAMGYCFSVRKERGFPKSLVPITDCLEKSGLIRARPAFGDLRPLAVQGVLLINAALTTRIGVAKAHVAAWKPFMGEFVQKLCELTTARYLLWGNVAQDLVIGHAKKHGREYYERAHPSPLSDNPLPPAGRFVNCDHFTRLNAALKAEAVAPIWWATDSPVFVFTDGSCLRNGAKDAVGGFGALIIGGHMGPTTMRGVVPPQAHALIDAADPEQGFTTAGGAASIAPTNNRAELLAICWALVALLRGRVLGRVTIVSDSQISVNTFNEWMPARRRKGTAHQLLNYDLLAIAEGLLAVLRTQADAVDIIHTLAAHNRKCPPRDGPGGARESCLWHGNSKADALAGTAGAEEIRFEIESPIAPVRHLAD